MHITSYVSGYRKSIFRTSSKKNRILTINEVLQVLQQVEGSCKDVLLMQQGRPIHHDKIDKNAEIVATLKLCGGKGGFGSMLRAIGAQIEKTTNREACRDLSGRRIRDINEEKRLKEYLSKKVDDEKKRLEDKKKKLERMNEDSKHIFEDKKYFEQREQREKDLYDALDKAFASTSKSNDENNTSKTNEESSSKNTIISKNSKYNNQPSKNSKEVLYSHSKIGSTSDKQKNRDQFLLTNEKNKPKKRFLDDLDESSEESEDELNYDYCYKKVRHY